MIRCLRAKIFPGAFATPTGYASEAWRERLRPRRRAGGFTMIELLVVLVILGLIAAFAVPQVMKYLGGAYRRAGGNVCGTVLRYNAGHYARRMNPISARYCRKARRIMGRRRRT